ncbi:MAG: XrtA-associated ATPase [Rhodospirillales bacterium]|nr:XrtA-associated ATPase [Rhodospirillales bacterium]
MYDTFFRLTGIPFQLTPDSRFFFGSAGHSRAISHLVYGLAQEEGFIVITGEVGAGKTTLVEHLWTQLDKRSYAIGRVVTTLVSGDDLLRLAVTSFGVGDDGADKATLLRRFEAMVHGQRAAGRRCLLVVDEAQNLSVTALEELRMLSNITIDGRASVQTILLGQPQFRTLLARPELEQLRQRVLASYHLGPLSERETRLYIEHRLKMVGWTDDPHWTDGAFIRLFRASAGIPRRVNTLCGRVLLYAALEEAHTVTDEMVMATAGELEQDLGAGTPEPALAPAVPSAPGETDPVARRLAAVEDRVSRQDRLFRRLLDLLDGATDGPEERLRAAGGASGVVSPR